MMPAAARRSGTRSPLASTLYRGSTVSAISRAVAAARAAVSLLLRERERAAEYAAFCCFEEDEDDDADGAVRPVRTCPASAVVADVISVESARDPIQKRSL